MPFSPDSIHLDGVPEQWGKLLVYISLPANFQERGPCLLAHAPSLSHSLSGPLTCATISCSAIHIPLVSLAMLQTGDMPLILQVQKEDVTPFRRAAASLDNANTQAGV